MKEFDAIIIGSGQAGTPLAKKLAKAGMKTALIEKEQVGGTCINDGCTPTKAMIACARIAYVASHGNDWGIEIKSHQVDFKKIISRKNEIVHTFRESTRKKLEETAGLTLIYGEASFTDYKTLNVKTQRGNEILVAEKIFINTGLKPDIPDVEGLEEVPYYTSTTMLDITEVPPRLLILGASYIGLEFGQMFRRFGSEVTIIEGAPQLLPEEDEDIAAMVREIMEGEGIKIFTSVMADKIMKDERGDLTITLNNGQTVTGSHVLLATGRVPATEILQPDKTGLETDDKGYIKVNGQLETNVPGIYALGDIKGGPAFTHISYNDYILVSKNLLEHAGLSTDGRQIPYCMFTDPQLGRIGMTEKEARAKNIQIKTAILPMENTGRGIETGNIKGMMKAVVDEATSQVLGAAILGAEGGEVMSVLQMAMLGNFTAAQVRNQVFAHPLYSESLNNLFMMLDK